MENLIITNQQGQNVTTSLIVAQVFGKEHKNVLRDIRGLECSPEFLRLNFEHTPYKNPQNGQTYDAYEMTKDGFSFLVMGYTGAKAAQFKETFIQEFNKREMLLQSEDYILLRSQEILKRRIEAQIKEIQALKIQNEELSNKASCYDKVIASEDCRTTTQIANEIGMTAKELHLKLKELGVIYHQSGQWLLHRPFSTYGMHKTRTATFTREYGQLGTRTQTVWTEQGRIFLRALHLRGFDKKECQEYFKWLAKNYQPIKKKSLKGRITAV